MPRSSLRDALFSRRYRSAPEPSPLTAEEREIGRSAGFPDAAVELLKSAADGWLSRLRGVTAGGEEYDAPGLTIEVMRGRAAEVRRRLRERLGPGYLVFETKPGFLPGTPLHVSVLLGTDQLQIPLTLGTSGANYGVTPRDVAERLRRWDAQYGLTINGAGDDWLEAEFHREPPDMLDFAQEVWEFCPDVVEQGTTTLDAAAAEMARENRVYLWWE
ncbi:MAG TPA: DUF4253 domain-containing protein [Longimicrobiaceae bacterium]|nr:DUF4253 domain-containing protein [Longimicrobiaceae bacterium]